MNTMTIKEESVEATVATQKNEKIIMTKIEDKASGINGHTAEKLFLSTDNSTNNKKWEWIQPISKEIFENKYQFKRESPERVFRDVAKTIAKVEDPSIRKEIEEHFYNQIISGKFIPAGRILANAYEESGIQNYMNCYTIGVEDSMEKIYDSLKEDALISKVGGGVGFDVSKLRPKNSNLSVGGQASGPISFLKVFDASAKVIMTGGARRAAHIALLDVSHPDIEEFITVKQGDSNKALTQFNISVKVNDKFIDAVEKDEDWNLEFEGKIYKTVKARYLYDLMSKNAFINNEPGIFNVDHINKYNNGWWAFDINEVNPCGEICMPKYSICCLGAINLTSFVQNKFEEDAYFDFEDFEKTIKYGVRFLDNVLSAAKYPLKKIEDNAIGWRRIGLGFTGLGNVFSYLKMAYGSDESKKLSDKIGKTLRDHSYLTSVELAKEKGPAPFINGHFKELSKSEFIKQLPSDIRSDIERFGLRNIALNTIAPTGTISLSVGQNCSSGIEPTFALQYTRNYRTGYGDEMASQEVYDNGWLDYIKYISPEKYERALMGEKVNISKPDWFTTTMEVDPIASIDIQAIFQKYIDHSISKTLNLPPGTTQEQYNELFMYAYKNGLKGFTTFNPEGSMKGILEYNEPKEKKSSKDQTEYVERHMAPERPDELQCDIHEVTVNKEKWIVLVGKLHGSLYEIFVDQNVDGEIDVNHHKYGIIKKCGRGKYSLIIKNGEERVVVENLAKTMDATYGVLARMVSMSLRHGTPLQFIVDQMSKSKHFMGFERAVSRVIKKYIKDGEKVMTGDVCPDCENTLIFKDGCVTCQSCGWSKCV